MDGLYELFYKDGQIEERGNYKDGELDGLSEIFYKDGRLRNTFCLKNGKYVTMSYCDN